MRTTDLTRWRRRLRRCLLLMPAAAVVAVAAPAQAVVPGQNGRIAYLLGPGGGDSASWVMSVQPDGGSPRQHVGANAWTLSSPVWAPDGHRLAYGFTVGATARVNVAETVGVAPTATATSAARPGTGVAWSPGGDRLALVRDRQIAQVGGGTFATPGVAVVPATGGAVLDLALGQDPSWSAAGAGVAFEDVFSGTGLAAVDPAAPNTSSPLGIDGAEPAWAPTGMQLAFVRGGDVVVADTVTLTETKLTQGAALDASPAWSPDGTKLVFSRRTSLSQQADLWVMDADGGNAHRITDTPARDETSPDWGTGDAVPPTVAIAAPVDGLQVDQGAQVAASYGCDDGPAGSGIAACGGDVPNGGALDTAAPGVHEFAVRAIDRAGNITTVTHHYTVADRTAPAVSIAPGNNAIVTVGVPFTLSYGCDDGPLGTGVALCEGPVPSGSPFTTTRGGLWSIGVRARDGAGNERTEAVNLRARYAFVGFQPPIRPGTGWTPMRVTPRIPLRFTLGGNWGLSAIDTDPASPATSWPRRLQVACSATPPRVRLGRRPPGVFAEGAPALWAPTGLYTYTLNAKAWATPGTCWAVFLKLDDGTTHRADLWFV